MRSILVHGVQVDKHLPDPAAVFYNTNSVDAIETIQEGGYSTRLWGLEDEQDFSAAREAGTSVLGSDFVDPDEFEWSDSSDPARDIPSFTILDQLPAPVLPEPEGILV